MLNHMRRLKFSISMLFVGLLLAGTPEYASTASPYATGAMLDPDIYSSVPKAAPLSRGDYDIPESYSLKKYTPTPGDQGTQGSCVGWSTAYAARTALESSLKRISRKADIDASKLSPAYVYNSIRQNDQCNGAYITDALAFIKAQGVAPLTRFAYSEKSCLRLPPANLRPTALPYRIGSYQRLFNSGSSTKHIKVRQALSRGHPVVIGMAIPNESSFYQTRLLWTPNAGDQAKLRANQWGGHAMAVIGYDDKKYGGAFEVINSWGTKWGNAGYFWMSYKSFNQFVFEGYAMLPVAPPKPKVVPAKPEKDLTASINFFHIDGADLPLKSEKEIAASRITRALPSGARIRTEIGVGQTSYVYVFGGDNRGRFVEIFPGRRNLNPQITADTTMLVPGPTEDYFTQLDQNPGQDYYLTLVSHQPINTDEFLTALNGAAADVKSRLNLALGKRKVSNSDIERDSSGKFSAGTLGSGIFAHVTYIDHVAADQGYLDRSPPKIVISKPEIDQSDLSSGEALPIEVVDGLIEIEGYAQDVSAIQDVRIEGVDTIRFNSSGRFKAQIEAGQNAKQTVNVEAIDAYGNKSLRGFVFALNRL